MLAPAPMDLATLSPALIPHPARHTGWSDSATVTLSPDLACGFRSDGRDLTLTELGHAGLSVLAAWELSTRNLIASAWTGQGYSFLTRAAGEGLEMRSTVSDMAAWLAHPRAFDIVHRHVQRLLGAPEPVYGLVLGVSGASISVFTHTRPARAHLPRAHLVEYRAGFPVTVG